MLLSLLSNNLDLVIFFFLVIADFLLRSFESLELFYFGFERFRFAKRFVTEEQ